MSLEYNKKLIPNAQKLRNNETKEEKRLWYKCLNQYERPIRFQRQKTINNYIVDFYCHRAKLVIELDGSQHHTEEGIESDAKRTAILEQYGLEVIRFRNEDVMKNLDDVCYAINQKVMERI